METSNTTILISSKTKNKAYKNDNMIRNNNKMNGDKKKYLINHYPQWLRETLAEMVGTYLMCMIGLNAVANYKLDRKSKIGVDHFAVAFTFGIGAMVGIAACQSISGSNMNPAVTLAFAIVGKLPFRKIPHYFLGQYIGAFLAAGTVYLTYHEAISAYDSGERTPYGFGNKTLDDKATGVLFSTYPAVWISVTGSLVDQIIATFSLVFCVLAVTHNRAKLPDYLHPFILGMTICGIVVAFGLNCGAALNPARDLSPRVFQLFNGYGLAAFKPVSSIYWLTAGIIGPHIGAIIAAMSYDLLLVDNNNENNKNDNRNEKDDKPIASTTTRTSA